jgi:PKD domain/Secretion system C-terminal sorting domain
MKINKRGLYFISIFLFISNYVFSQKFDNNWMMGYHYSDYPEFPGIDTYQLTFDTFPPRYQHIDAAFQFKGASSSLCDSSGNLLLYTNNCKIANGNHEIIVDGDSIPEGFDWNEICLGFGGGIEFLGNLLLSDPKNSRRVYSISKTLKFITQPVVEAYQDKVQFAIIDLDAADGRGSLLSKGNTVIEGKFTYGHLTAVKHGNGRDWWLPMADLKGNKIHMLLLDATGLREDHIESVGQPWEESAVFQASFSADGSRLARFNPFYGVYLYDFDRCDGTLSNPKHFADTSTMQALVGGCAFSPNGRYLYYSFYEYVYQLDLEAADIWASRHLVAEYDEAQIDLPTWFMHMQTGPDGRIYIFTPNTTRVMHVINRPNLPWDSCKLVQHELIFPVPYANYQNFPNFRLGALDGSMCDTLGFDNHPQADFRPDPSDTSGLAYQFWDISSYRPTHWEWDFGDGLQSTTQSPSHVYAGPGLYTVCLRVWNEYGVSTTHCKVVEVRTVGTTSVVGGHSTLSVFPNPTTGLCYISGLQDGKWQATIQNVAGKQISLPILGGNHVDLQDYPSGIYFLQLIEKETKKVEVLKVFLIRE